MGVGQRVESEVETEINAKPKQRGSVGLLDCLCSQRSLEMALSWKEGRQVDAELKLPILKLSVIDKYTFPKWSPSALLLKGVVVTWLSFWKCEAMYLATASSWAIPVFQNSLLHYINAIG